MSAGQAAPPADGDGWHPGHNPWLIALVVTMATFMEVLDTSIANVALPHIAGGLSAGQDESTWVLTSYLVSNAIVLPISGWISNMIGRKRFYMICVFLFTVSSFLCGLAPSLAILIVCRILQGFGGGGLAPSEQAILADTFPVSKRGIAFAVYGIAVVTAPAIGPTLGGWITDNYSWRWIFYINIPVGVLSLYLTNKLVQDPPWVKKAKSAGIKIDYIGLAFIAIGLGCLQVVLDKGEREDWFESHFIVLFTAITVFSLLFVAFWEWRHDHPIIEVRLLGQRTFLIANVSMFFLGAVLFGTTLLLPLMLQTLMGYTAEEAGMVLSPGGLMVIALLPMVGLLVSKVDVRYVIAFGFFITSLALFHLSHLSLDIGFKNAVYARMFQASGLAFLFVPISTAAYAGMPKEKSNQVSGMTNLFRNIGGSVGISAVTTMVAQRTQFHQTVLAAHATPYDSGFRATVAGTSHLLQQHGASAALATKQTYGLIYGTINRQAAIQGYLDTYWIMGFIAMLLVPFVFLMKKAKGGGEGAAVH